MTHLGVNKPLLFVLAVFGVLIFLIKAPLTASVAMQDRVFQNNIKKEVPIKLQIKKEKEKSFKELKNGQWIGEFELELTNTGDKPIYFLYITLVSDVQQGGTPFVFPLQYGRSELGDILTKAESQDVPIKPGETYVFTIHPGQIKAWEKIVTKGESPDATKLSAELQALSFGDGTGYFGNTPYPRPGLEKLIREKRGEALNKGQPKPPAWFNNERATSTIVAVLSDTGFPSQRAKYPGLVRAINSGWPTSTRISCHLPSRARPL
jgi:hypothetical protein